MEPGKCQTTTTARFREDQTDPQVMPDPVTWECDREGDWHQVHRDPIKGVWMLQIGTPKPGLTPSLD